MTDLTLRWKIVWGLEGSIEALLLSGNPHEKNSVAEKIANGYPMCTMPKPSIKVYMFPAELLYTYKNFRMHAHTQNVYMYNLKVYI
jgi:hypothetical protein